MKKRHSKLRLGLALVLISALAGTAGASPTPASQDAMEVLLCKYDAEEDAQRCRVVEVRCAPNCSTGFCCMYID